MVSKAQASGSTSIVVIGMGSVRIPCAALLADVQAFQMTGEHLRSRRSGWKTDSPTGGESSFEGDEPAMAELIHRTAVQKSRLGVTVDYTVCRDADVIRIDVQAPTDRDHVLPHQAL